MLYQTVQCSWNYHFQCIFKYFFFYTVSESEHFLQDSSCLSRLFAIPISFSNLNRIVSVHRYFRKHNFWYISMAVVEHIQGLAKSSSLIHKFLFYVPFNSISFLRRSENSLPPPRCRPLRWIAISSQEKPNWCENGFFWVCRAAVCCWEMSCL